MKRPQTLLVTALLAALLLASLGPQQGDALLFGLLGYGTCQSGCNAVAVACYAAAGFTFGTVTAGAGVPPAIAACNTALGTCMAACAVVALAL